MEFRILGALEVAQNGQPIQITGRRQRELLALLLVRANRTVPIDSLVDALWGERPPPTARRQVQNAIGRLRRTLGAGGGAADVIETRPGGYLLRAGPDGHAMVTVVISGKGGIGKTSLAVHLAHRLREVFRDGQLYVDLRAAHGRVEPAEVLARFLRAIGVPGRAIPHTLEERAEMYRELLAERRVLVVLDNAADAAQVRPLLPGLPGCAVLVTSRSRLTELPGARLVEPGVLETGQALELLAQIVGPERVRAEPDAAAALVEQCGRLPLALRIAGAKLAARPHWTLRHMTRRLADEHRRLDELAHGDLEVRASLALSYRGLSPSARRLLHLLSLLAAPDFAAWVGAAVLDTAPGPAGELIDQLVDAQLLDVCGRDAAGQPRYRFHDLTLLYAREQALAAEPPARRAAALGRALGGWLALTERAHRAVHGGDFAVLHGTAPRWHPADEELYRTIDADPLVWYETERPNLVAATEQAAREGCHELCWDLAASAVSLFLARGHYDEWERSLGHGLAVTRRHGNRRGMAAMLTGLGLLDAYRHRYPRATRMLQEALDLFRRLDDRHGLALAGPVIAHVVGAQGDHAQAIAHHLETIEVLRELGDRGAEILALRSLGQLLVEIGRPRQALPHLKRALELGDAGHRRAHVEVTFCFAEALLACGEVAAADKWFRRLFELAERNGDLRGLAAAHYGMGMIELHADRLRTAVEFFHQALGLYLRTGERRMEGRVRLALGELYRRERAFSEAIGQLTLAVTVFGEIGAVLWQARALDLLGDVHAARNGPADAALSRDAWGRARSLLAQVSSADVDRILAELGQEADHPLRPQPPWTSGDRYPTPCRCAPSL